MEYIHPQTYSGALLAKYELKLAKSKYNGVFILFFIFRENNHYF